MKTDKPKPLPLLIRLLIVLAVVLAFFSGLLIPFYGCYDNATLTRSGNNISQIAKSHFSLTLARNDAKPIDAESVHQWAIRLAQAGGINNAEVYRHELDPAVKIYEGAWPKAIVSREKEVNPEFLDSPISYAIVANIPPDLEMPNVISIPLMWTRGLFGFSELEGSPAYLSGGGHVAYLDGHVEWYELDNLKQSIFYKYGTEEPTSDPREAIPPGAHILVPEPLHVNPERRAELIKASENWVFWHKSVPEFWRENAYVLGLLLNVCLLVWLFRRYLRGDTDGMGFFLGLYFIEFTCAALTLAIGDSRGFMSIYGMFYYLAIWVFPIMVAAGLIRLFWITGYLKITLILGGVGLNLWLVLLS